MKLLSSVKVTFATTVSDFVEAKVTSCGALPEVTFYGLTQSHFKAHKVIILVDIVTFWAEVTLTVSGRAGLSGVRALGSGACVH